MTKKIGIVIQARTGSTRLPNKVILPFYREQTILDILIEKLLVFKDNHPIILATTETKEDKLLIGYAKKYNIDHYIGNELDVLQRFVGAADKFSLDVVIRICADNPFLEVGYIQQLIDAYNIQPELDYISFQNSYGVPAIRTHLGLFAEIVSVSALKKVQQQTDQKFYKEHVTNFIYANPNIFKINLLEMPDYLKDRGDLRFTLDDAEDFTHLKELYQYYINHKADIKSMINHIDSDEHTLESMISNIKKYEK